MSLARSVIFNIIGKDSASPAFLSAAKSAEAAAARIDRTAARIQKSGAVMQAAGAKMSKAITLPVVAAAAVSVDQAAKYQKALNTIQVATDQTNRSMSLGSKGLEKIAVETGQSLSQLSDALYTATKSGMPMAQALKVVEASAKGAAAEGADLGVATQALTSIMASYGKSLGNPVKAENELIRGAGLAKTTYQDFAASLSNVVPLASSLHISFAQVAGAVDTMTQHGETAQRATDNLSNLITNLAGQNNVASAALQQLGVKTIDLSKNLGKRGLTGSLDDVLAAINKHRKDGVIVTSAFKQAATATYSLRTELDHLPKSMQANANAFVKGTMSYKDFYAYAKSLGGQQYAMAKDLITTQRAASGFNKQLTSGNSTVSTLARTLQKALGGVTGMRVALMLSGASAKTFKSAVNAISDAAVESGADILGWAKTQETADNKMNRAKESLQVLAVEIGNALIPVVVKVTDAVSKAVKWFESLSSTDKKFIGYSVVVLAALGPVLAIVGRITKAVGLMWAAGAASGRFIAGVRGAEISLAGMESKSYLAGLKLRGMGTAATGLAAALGGAAIGYGVGSLTANASTATKTIGLLGSTAAGAAVGFAVGGPLGAGIGAVAGGLADATKAFHLFGGAAKSQIKPTQAFTQAILADNDALGKNTRSLVENSLQSKGAYDAALKLGINQKTLTDAMMGNAGALAKVQAAQLGVTASIGYGTTATSHLTKAQKAQIDANSKLSDVIGFVSQTLKVNQHAANNIAAANGKQAKSADAVASSTSNAAAATQAATSKGNAYLGVLAKLAKDHKVKVSADVLNALEGIRRVAVELGGLHGKTIMVKSIYSSTGKVTMKAAGGTIVGPGTGTSDSVPIMASNGEEVIRASQAAKHRGLLKAINAGVAGFADGGTVGTISLGHAQHGTTVSSLLGSGGLGTELFGKLRMAGNQLVASVLSVAASLHRVQGSSSSAVSHAIAGSVAPDPSTPAGWVARLAAAQKLATADREHYEIARQNVQALNQRAAALDRNAKKMADAASAMKSSTKAEKAAKTAAEDQAKAAQKVADAADKMASRAKSAYDKIKSASQSATEKAKADAQSLVQAVQSSFDTLQQQIQGFQSSITQGLTAGSDLNTIWGNATSNLDSMKQALDAAQSALAQATPDTSKLAAAQAAQAQATAAQAAAHAALTQALAGGDAAAILAAQQAQTTAASQLAAAQQAVTAATPTADQLAAQAAAQQDLTAATNAYAQAQKAASAGGVADVLAQFAASEKQFASDLTQLQKDGAGQALIDQLASMGAAGGDALAQGLINDPKSLAAISKSMDAINNIAGQESDKLAKGYYGAGVKSMEQLLAGIEKQFPSLVKALAPLAAQLAAMFTFTPTVTGKSVTTDALHQLGTVAKDYGVTVAQLIAANPSLKGDTSKSAIKKGTQLTIPSFAQGVTDFAGGLAMVHRDELLVNLPRGTDVIPANRAKPAAFGGQDNSALIAEVRALRAEVRALPRATGQEVGAATLRGYERAGQEQGKQLVRSVRKQ